MSNLDIAIMQSGIVHYMELALNDPRLSEGQFTIYRRNGYVCFVFYYKDASWNGVGSTLLEAFEDYKAQCKSVQKDNE